MIYLIERYNNMTSYQTMIILHDVHPNLLYPISSRDDGAGGMLLITF